MFFYWAFFLGICDVTNGQVVIRQSTVSSPQLAVKVKDSQEVEMRKCLVKVALSQTHVRERTGRNDGVEIRRYLRLLNLPEGTPYCGAFVEWVYRQCGVVSNVQAPAVAFSWAKYPNRVVWQRGLIRGKKLPQLGDVAVFGWRQRTGGIRYHTEVVLEWDADDEIDDFVTVGGNTSAPQTRSPVFVRVKGEGVHKKLREKDEAVVSNHISGSLEVKPRPLVNPFVTL